MLEYTVSVYGLNRWPSLKVHHLSYNPKIINNYVIFILKFQGKAKGKINQKWP